MLRSCGAFTLEEADELIENGCLNGLFVLGRSIGFIGHYLDQKRLKQPLYRHPWDGKTSRVCVFCVFHEEPPFIICMCPLTPRPKTHPTTTHHQTSPTTTPKAAVSRACARSWGAAACGIPWRAAGTRALVGKGYGHSGANSKTRIAPGLW